MTPIVLLANGPSLSAVDFTRLKYPRMGMNRSHMLDQDPEYFVCLEPVHYKAHPAFFDRMARKGGLYVVGAGWPCGKNLAFGSGTFSRDVFRDGVVTQIGDVGSVFYAALQVAYTLGYRKVYALGLDLHGDHFDGSPASSRVEEQNKLFQHCPSDLEILVAGSPESRAIFPKVELEEVYG